MKIDVKNISKLANISLASEEILKFEDQLLSILTYIETLNKLDTSNIEPTYQVTGLTNVLRADDNTHESLTQKEALSNTKSTNEGYFVVEQILEEK